MGQLPLEIWVEDHLPPCEALHLSPPGGGHKFAGESGEHGVERAPLVAACVVLWDSLILIQQDPDALFT